MTPPATQLSIDGMSCQHCVSAVRRVLTAIPGVAVDDVQIGSAVVRAEPAALKAASAALASEGYNVRDGAP